MDMLIKRPFLHTVNTACLVNLLFAEICHNVVACNEYSLKEHHSISETVTALEIRKNLNTKVHFPI